MLDIYQEIKREWMALHQGMPSETPERAELFSELCGALETEYRRHAIDRLQPWLGIFEFGIEWLTYVHMGLDTQHSNHDRPYHRVASALTGSAVSFGYSLRTLCLSGFVTPALTLLRTYDEALLLCLAALYDEDFAHAYQNAQNAEQARKFWDEHASPTRLQRRMTQLEQKMGLDRESIGGMAKYRAERQSRLSQSAHLSYDAAGLTAAVEPTLSDDDRFRSGILKFNAEVCQGTILSAAFTTWYFSRLAPLQWLPGFDRESDWQRRIAIAKQVLSTISLRHFESHYAKTSRQRQSSN